MTTSNLQRRLVRATNEAEAGLLLNDRNRVKMAAGILSRIIRDTKPTGITLRRIQHLEDGFFAFGMGWRDDLPTIVGPRR